MAARHNFRILIETNQDGSSNQKYIGFVSVANSYAVMQADTSNFTTVPGHTFHPENGTTNYLNTDLYLLDADTQLNYSSSEMYNYIRSMRGLEDAHNTIDQNNLYWTGSAINGTGESGQITDFVNNANAAAYGYTTNAALLSCSLHKSKPEDSTADATGSIKFTPITNATYGSVRRYKFFGEKVCTVLGLPVNMWIYPESLNIDTKATGSAFFGGDINAVSLNVRNSFVLSNVGSVDSDLSFNVNGGDGATSQYYDRWIKWVDINTANTAYPLPPSGVRAAGLLMGYNSSTKKYELKTVLPDQAGFKPFHITGSNLLLDNAGGAEGKLTVGGTSTFTGVSTFTSNIIANGNIVGDGSTNISNINTYDGQVFRSQAQDTTFMSLATNSIIFNCGGGTVLQMTNQATHFYEDVSMLEDVNLGNASGDIITINGTATFNANTTLGNAVGDLVTINGTTIFNGNSTTFNKTATPIYLTADGNDQFVFRKDGNTLPHTFVDQGNNDGAGTYYGFRFYKYNGGTTESTVDIKPNGELVTHKNPSFAIKKSADESVGAAWETVTFNTEQYDLNSNYDGTNKFTAPVAGRYLFLCTLRWNPGASSHYVWSRLLKNGSAVRYGEILDANEVGTGDGGLDDMSTVMNEILDLNANDYVQVQVYSANATSTLVGHDGSGEGTSFSGHLLG